MLVCALCIYFKLNTLRCGLDLSKNREDALKRRVGELLEDGIGRHLCVFLDHLDLENCCVHVKNQSPFDISLDAWSVRVMGKTRLEKANFSGGVVQSPRRSAKWSSPLSQSSSSSSPISSSSSEVYLASKLFSVKKSLNVFDGMSISLLVGSRLSYVYGKNFFFFFPEDANTPYSMRVSFSRNQYHKFTFPAGFMLASGSTAFVHWGPNNFSYGDESIHLHWQRPQDFDHEDVELIQGAKKNASKVNDKMQPVVDQCDKGKSKGLDASCSALSVDHYDPDAPLQHGVLCLVNNDGVAHHSLPLTAYSLASFRETENFERKKNAMTAASSEFGGGKEIHRLRNGNGCLLM